MYTLYHHQRFKFFLVTETEAEKIILSLNKTFIKVFDGYSIIYY